MRPKRVRAPKISRLSATRRLPDTTPSATLPLVRMDPFTLATTARMAAAIAGAGSAAIIPLVLTATLSPAAMVRMAAPIALAIDG